MYRTFFIRIPVVPHIVRHKYVREFLLWISPSVVVVVVVVVARKESQPAVQAGSQLSRGLSAASCVAASRLCRHSAQTHPPYNASVLSRVFRTTLQLCCRQPQKSARCFRRSRCIQKIVIFSNRLLLGSVDVSVRTYGASH